MAIRKTAKRAELAEEDLAAEEMDGEHIGELSYEEGWKLFDEGARELLGISGEEFLRRWDAGEYRGIDTTPVIHMMMLIPFVRGT